MIIPLEGILCYALFNLCLFYQKLFIERAQIRLMHNRAVKLALLSYGIAATVFGIAFILFWGWKVSWSDAAVLYIFAFVITKFWGPVEAKLRLSRVVFIHFLISFVGLIGLAIALIRFIPQ
jgi:hypothetical protein